MNFNELKQQALTNPQVKSAYDAMDAEFALIHQLLAMRQQAGLTQQQVAERMGTKKSNISRLERGNSNPGWSTLTNYAKACGFQLALVATAESSPEVNTPKSAKS
jgi:transcriptional regulator with XRE-family HTH domain